MKILLAALTSSFMLVGCTPRIEVAAPKEPITINMNVKIEHEIIIKADKDVEELLEKPVAIFFEVMMKRTLLLCAFLVGLVSSNVMALTLDEARTQGRVGETFYGYLVALKTDAETEKLVTDINAERKASYQQLAKQNNVSVDDIAKLAGQKLVERAKPGEYVQGINGKWVRKF